MSGLKKASFDINRARAAFGKQNNQQFERTPYYPFHKLPEGKSTTLRFIPDANPDNELGFLVERKMHEIYVDGERQRVACLEMYGDDCPICDLSRQYYKAKDTVNGKKYWPKKDHIARALIVKDGLPPDPETGETYVGKVATLSLGKTLYEIIAHNISSGDLGDELPCSIDEGTDFIITRTVKPGPNGEKYSDYALSKFARASRGLEEEEVATIEMEDDNGNTPNYVSLATLLPKKPTLEFVENILESSLNESGEDAPAPRAPARKAAPVDEASVDDEPVAPARGKKQPAPWEDDEAADAAPVPKPVIKKAPPAPAAEAEDDGEDDAEAFLAQIRAKRAAQRAAADE
jgi:hypothetical protein